MSKYDEICAAYAKARTAWEDHRQACREFTADLADKLAADLGAPREDIFFLPPNVTYDPREVRPVDTALTYGADGAFHYGLALRVRPATGNPITEVLLVQISIARNPGGFELRVQDLNEPIRMPLKFAEESKGHRAFLDLFAKRAVTTFAEHDLRYTELADNSRPMLR
jgi:hypothetical protein